MKAEKKIRQFIDYLFWLVTPGLWLRYHFPEMFEEKQKWVIS